MRPYSKTLHIVGTGTMILSMASPFALLCTPNSQWFTIGTMFAETLLLAQGTKEWIKKIKDAMANNPDANVSDDDKAGLTQLDDTS